MDIYPKKGQKIKYLGHNNRGSDFDQNYAKVHLKVGGVYTVEKSIVYAWNTDIVLREFPKSHFNSVLFEECDHELN